MPIDYQGAIERANFRITTLKAFEIQVKALPKYSQDLLDALCYFNGLHQTVQIMDDETANMLPVGIHHRICEIGPLISHLRHVLTSLDGTGSNARCLEPLMKIVKRELP